MSIDYCYLKSNRFFAFNIWDCNSAEAVIKAASLCNNGVILQTSSKVFKAIDERAMRVWITNCALTYGVSVFLHLDHCRDLELLKCAVDCGWDSVMLDASHLSLDDNITLSNEASSYAHSKNVFLEAEIGQIKGVEDDVISVSGNTVDITEVKRFLDDTSVDMLACAIGTMHGSYNNRPNIDHQLIYQLALLSDVPFVVHGASGLQDSELRQLLAHPNVRKINVSTELKLAYQSGFSIASEYGLFNQAKFDPLSVNQILYGQVEEAAKSKINLLNES